MGLVGGVWRLWHGAEAVGTITVTDADMPWLRGPFTPGPGYPALAPWFATMVALLDAEEYDRFEAEYEPVASTLTLVSPDDGPVESFLLHLEGGEAAFRWAR